MLREVSCSQNFLANIAGAFCFCPPSPPGIVLRLDPVPGHVTHPQIPIRWHSNTEMVLCDNLPHPGGDLSVEANPWGTDLDGRSQRIHPRLQASHGVLQVNKARKHPNTEWALIFVPLNLKGNESLLPQCFRCHNASLGDMDVKHNASVQASNMMHSQVLLLRQHRQLAFEGYYNYKYFVTRHHSLALCFAPFQNTSSNLDEAPLHQSVPRASARMPPKLPHCACLSMGPHEQSKTRNSSVDSGHVRFLQELIYLALRNVKTSHQKHTVTLHDLSIGRGTP